VRGLAVSIVAWIVLVAPVAAAEDVRPQPPAAVSTGEAAPGSKRAASGGAAADGSGPGAPERQAAGSTTGPGGRSAGVGQAQQRADALWARGRALGKRGLFTAAIALFKQAEREYPRAAHSCNIASMYLWLRRPIQAYAYLRDCQVRARDAGSKERRWSEPRLAAVAAQVRERDYGLLKVRVEPVPRFGGARMTPQVTVSELAPDEWFAAPFELWLPEGEHVVRARAPGHETRVLRVRVRAGSENDARLTLQPLSDSPAAALRSSPPLGNLRDLRLRWAEQLVRPGAPGTAALAPPGPGAPGPVTEQRRGSLFLPWVVAGTGAALLVGGGVVNGFAWTDRQRADRLQIRTDEDNREFDRLAARFRVQRAIAVGLYAAGGVGLAGGLYWLWRRTETRSTTPEVWISGDGAGGSVRMDW
jgi:hypothetical protein